jgi:hypothetical protein
VRAIFGVLFILWAQVAHAYDFRVVVLSSPKWAQGYVSPATVQTAIAEAVALHAAHGVPLLRLKDIRYKQDPAPNLDRYEDAARRLYAIRDSALHRTMRRNVDFVFYVVSPMNFNGVNAMAGLASGYCMPPRQRISLAIGQMRDFNDAGLPRQQHSTVILAHEMGHLLGMYHVQSPTLMHQGALSFLPNNLSFIWDPQNINQLRSCYRSFR